MFGYLSGQRQRAWIDTCVALGQYAFNHTYSQDYWQCRKDAEAGDERAKQYLTVFAAELLKG